MYAKSAANPRIPQELLTLMVALFVITLACNGGTPPPSPTPAPSPTPTPKVGGRVFGVECQPAALNMLHGETKNTDLTDLGGVGQVSEFKIGTIVGTTIDADASEIEVSQDPAPGGTGWSSLPGAIQVTSTAVDGPPRTETYLINILLGGGQGTGQIAGGNLWCQVNVQHEVAATPTPTTTPYPTLTPPVIITGDGFRITYTGPLQAQTTQILEASFLVTGPNDQPAQGTFSATLGEPPSDPNASHASGPLDQEGKITLMLSVNWPAGTTKLYCSFNDTVYEVTEIAISP